MVFHLENICKMIKRKNTRGIVQRTDYGGEEQEIRSLPVFISEMFTLAIEHLSIKKELDSYGETARQKWFKNKIKELIPKADLQKGWITFNIKEIIDFKIIDSKTYIKWEQIFLEQLKKNSYKYHIENNKLKGFWLGEKEGYPQ